MLVQLCGRFRTSAARTVERVAPSLEPLESRRHLDGEYDNTFSFDGKALTSFNQPGAAEALAVAVQPDGKAVAGGYATFTSPLNGSSIRHPVLARYNLDGTLDNSFDGDGQWVGGVSSSGLFHVMVVGVAVQPDGKILALTSTRVNGTLDGGQLYRLLPGGAPDPMFGNNGSVPILSDGSTAEVRAINVDREDRIVVTGTFENDGVVARFTSGGDPDPTFGILGRRIVSRGAAHRLVLADADLMPSGHIVLAGGTESPHSMIVARLTSSGHLDNNFGLGGIVRRTTSWPGRYSAIAVAPNNVVWAGGYLIDGGAPEGVYVYTDRFAIDGSALANAEVGHSIGTGYNGLTPLSDGKFLSLVPTTTGPRLRRLYVSGTGFLLRDASTFSPTGSPPGTTWISWTFGTPDFAEALAVSPTGRAYVVGSADVLGEPQQFAIAALVGAPNQAPRIDRSRFDFETAHRVQFQFNEPINPTSLGADDLVVTNLDTGLPVDTSAATVAYSAPTRTATWTLPAILDDGNYRAALAPSSVADIAGATNLETGEFGFFVLTGDANHDRTVNLQDFNILAINFGQSPRTFSQGDFNYDGVVNLQDFNRLASKFGTSLPASPQMGGSTAAQDKHTEQQDDDVLADLLN
jgi:uncharacterized delta-60 repeat protein